MPLYSPQPDIAPEAIIPIPGGIVVSPVSDVAAIAAQAVHNHKLITDPVITLAATLDGLTYGAPTQVSVNLMTALAAAGVDAPLVATLATSGDLREPLHLSDRPGLAALRDILLPPTGAADPVTANASPADIAEASRAPREIRYSTEVQEGLHLVGPPSALPSLHELINDATHAVAPASHVLEVVHAAVTLDWTQGLGGFDGRYLVEASDVNAIQRDDVARSRIRNVRAFSMLLVPALSPAVFYWRCLRRLASIPEMAEVLRRLDYPIGRGDEDKALIDAVNALPLAPTLAAVIDGLFTRSGAVETMFGSAPIQRLPSWFCDMWEAHRLTPVNQADPLHALEAALTQVFGPNGPYHNLTRALGQWALPGSDITPEILMTSGKLGWGTPSPATWEQESGYYQLAIAHTDGTSCDWLPSHLHSLRSRTWFFGGTIGSARAIVDNPNVTGFEASPFLAFERDQTLRPVATAALRDPTTIVGINAGVRPYWRNAELVPATIAGLRMMCGFRSLAHLEAAIAAHPNRWAHLVHIDPATGALAVNAGIDEFARSEYSYRRAHGQLLRVGQRTVHHYFRFAGSQLTRAWDPMVANPGTAIMPEAEYSAEYIWHVTGRGPALSLDPAVLAPVVGGLPRRASAPEAKSDLPTPV